MNKAHLIAALLLLTGGAFGQSAEKLTFEVASVKPAELPTPGPGRGMVLIGRRGGPGTNDPGQMVWNATTLMALLTEAYDMKRYQITGPDWLDMDRYDIKTKLAPDTTKDQARVMLQNLITERWGMTLHHQSKVFQVEEMVAVKGGSKLKETDLDPNAAPDPKEAAPPPGPPKLDKNGVPELKAPGLMMMMTMGPNGPNARMVGKAQTIAQLANMVGNQLNKAVVDKTGLTGKYDFVLEFAPDPSSMPMMPGGMGRGPGPGPGGPGPGGPGDGAQIPGANDPSGLNLQGALQQQLGLRLQSNKAPLDTIVIDKVNRTPAEN